MLREKYASMRDSLNFLRVRREEIYNINPLNESIVLPTVTYFLDASKGAAYYDGSLFDQIKELQNLERNLIR